MIKRNLYLLGLSFCLFFAMTPSSLQAFEEAKYGSDFLSVGGGARPLGMGSAYTSVTRDVLSGYWNPAGLTGVDNWQFVYMHAERFSGIVGYDYGAFAMPVSQTGGVIGVSFFRQGVDGIKNTLHAWDHDNNRPKADPGSHIDEFSSSDMAFYLSYANPLRENLDLGVSAKLLHSRLGSFATAWGYSLDLGLQWRADRYRLGIHVMDITTMMKFWNIDQSKLKDLEKFTNPFTNEPETIPDNRNEYIRPSLNLGASTNFDFGSINLLASLDTRIRFEGRRTYYLNAGDFSFEPRLGVEAGYMNLVFIRAGVTDVLFNDNKSPMVSPTLGTGLKIGAFMVDYGFTSFAGIASDLGFTHRISLQLNL